MNVQHSKWQNKLLPLMTRMLIGLTVFFFIASFFQLFYLHNKIEDGPKLELTKVISTGKVTQGKDKEKAGLELQIMQWQTLATLDEHTLRQRYHQANVLLMARIWTRYLSFVTGMILCLVGSSFILGKLETSETTVEGKSEAGEFSIKSTSPGIILSVLGTVLILTSVLVHNDIKVTDGPAYLHLNFPEFLSKPESELLQPDTDEKKTEEYDKFYKDLYKRNNKN